ncbi:MAG: DUF448 domain-containing protein [Pseudomonas fluorescens]|nr:MAG: DUF448 domain-containing protein [Pseudomonas fluorescens]
MTTHQPIRTCVATGKKLPQNELVRFVNVGGVPTPERCLGPHRAAGRGVYIQPNAQALAMAIKKKAFAHRLKTNRPPLTWEEIEPLLQSLPPQS